MSPITVSFLITGCAFPLNHHCAGGKQIKALYKDKLETRLHGANPCALQAAATRLLATQRCH